MNFAFTEEQEELRSFIRAFMEEKSAEATVRELMETEDGFDAAVWSQMAEQLGLQSMIIPEEYGGQGFGYVELGIALEEMGRSLLCAPFFSTVVLVVTQSFTQGTSKRSRHCCQASQTAARSQHWLLRKRMVVGMPKV